MTDQIKNLLEETIEIIQENNLDINDIIFIGSEETGHRCTWEEFKILANKEYDSGLGLRDVAADLIIIFKDGSRMYRDEYEGSEWWECIKAFQMPKKFKIIKNLFGMGGDFCLETIQEETKYPLKIDIDDERRW